MFYKILFLHTCSGYCGFVPGCLKQLKMKSIAVIVDIFLVYLVREFQKMLGWKGRVFRKALIRFFDLGFHLTGIWFVLKVDALLPNRIFLDVDIEFIGVCASDLARSGVRKIRSLFGHAYISLVKFHINIDYHNRIEAKLSSISFLSV